MIKHQEFTHIGQNSKLHGSFHFQGKTQLEGAIIGEIHMLYQSPLILGIDSKVEGKIFCHNLEIYGVIEADIESSGKVVIYPSAEVSGTIKAKSIEVLPGAEVNMAAHTLT